VARMDGERTEGASGVSTSNSEPLPTEKLVARLFELPHTKGTLDGDSLVHYMHLQMGQEQISGYLPREHWQLLAAAPDLLAMVKRYASECADCGGTGRIVTRSGGSGWGNGGPDVREEVEPCGECEDIRKVIAKAEGRS